MLIGCDFSSSPTARKPIVVAMGEATAGCVRLRELRCFDTLAAWGDWLAQPQCWVGGFDLPLGLPRTLVEELGWPTEWAACMDHYCALSRDAIRTRFRQFCDARPVGGKLAHRATDGPAGSSPSMKWVNPPVAFMLHAGVPLLRQAGVHMPGLCPGDVQRVALEAYPGLLAREVLQRRSYKSDERAKQTAERLLARHDLVTALERGSTRLELRLQLSNAQREAVTQDPSGDSVDAVLCMLQAAWAQAQYAAGDALYGLPPTLDPLEGWIVTAPFDGAPQALSRL